MAIKAIEVKFGQPLSELQESEKGIIFLKIFGLISRFKNPYFFNLSYRARNTSIRFNSPSGGASIASSELIRSMVWFNKFIQVLHMGFLV
tara:strand:+ start:563 stop:832 length:270 start_codon:yes stop_codon:yes gene_type:complete